MPEFGTLGSEGARPAGHGGGTPPVRGAPYRMTSVLNLSASAGNQPSARMASIASCSEAKMRPSPSAASTPCRLQIGQEVRADPAEEDPDALAGKLLEQGSERLRGRKIQVDDRLRVDDAAT